ncbi:hypothetical protein ACH5RR_034270, partial [Cinchona calisaya]
MTGEDVARGSFLSFLLSMENQVDNLSEGLAFPLMVLTDPPENYTEDMELTLTLGIADVARESGFLDYSFCVSDMPKENVRKIEIRLSKLMQQIKLTKAEIFLLELQNHKENLMVSAVDHIAALKQALRFLTKILKAPVEYMEYSGNLIVTHLEALIRKAASFYNIFHARKVTEDIVLKSSLAIYKLFKAEAMLMMLIDSNSSLTFLMKYRLQTLHEGLMFLRGLITVPPKNMDNGKFSSALIEAMATEAASFICSFGDSKMKEDQSMGMDLFLSHLPAKIEL